MEIITAYDNKRGIGRNNKLPWNIVEDMNFFQNMTIRNIVIMGRNTWESIPEKFRPLKNRINYIVSSKINKKNLSKFTNVFIFEKLNECLQHIVDCKYTQKIFVIGGEKLYSEAINHYNLSKVHITEIYNNYNCDTFFPKLSDRLILTKVSNFQKTQDGSFIRFFTYEKNTNKAWINLEEMQYISMLNNIINTGIKRTDRTGVGTLSKFGKHFEYDLKNTFPLLTTKRMFVRAIFEELALYISGKTDNGILQKKGIHIWDGNTTREFLDKRGLSHYKENDMGETYGFNFRHYGAEYNGCSEDYTNKGFDQLKYVISEIRKNPQSRRLIINLWNASTMDKAALPACLCMYQFYVDTEKKMLNLQIYIRSSDFFLANNWNTCTGAFLVHMICNLKDIDLSPGKLSVITGDTHIYLSHLEAVKKNLERIPRPFPKLIIKEEKERIEDYKWEDFRLIGYNPYPNITAPMAI